MLKQVTIGYHALNRAASRHNVVVGFPGDGPFVDVEATPLVGHRVSQDPEVDEPGTYAVAGRTLAGNLFLSLLLAGGE